MVKRLAPSTVQCCCYSEGCFEIIDFTDGSKMNKYHKKVENDA